VVSQKGLGAMSLVSFEIMEISAIQTLSLTMLVFSGSLQRGVWSCKSSSLSEYKMEAICSFQKIGSLLLNHAVA
jgi:hypothetical protein